ncbi:global transcription regulator sge1-like [Teratosphaeria destructans]|uniref:Global transcription regulator sge1-like n=1 Tax=Teratosphaeria destructans TaxID=418781 RepID=A0A9W7W3C8_9PEZI|nr:global transcription regulator sge1-like [Teratosphaeria destructans]
MSISVNGISHHMVSYYKVDDVKNGMLPRPLSDPRLANIAVRPELYLKQNFRAPVEETEQYALDGQGHAYPQVMYPPMAGAYGVRPGQYIGTPQGFSMYGMTPATSTYGGMTPSSAAAWSTPQSATGGLPYSGHAGYGSQYGGSNLYRVQTSQPGAPPVKAEESQVGAQNSSYNHPYGQPYSSMARNSTHTTPLMTGSYQTSVQQGSSYGSMGAQGNRQSYGSTTMPSPTTNGQAQHGYASTSHYPVRSPVQSYPMGSAPNSAVTHSPHTDLKSPMPGGHGPPGGDYRSSSYQPQQSAHHSSDMSGLGISSSTPYPTAQQNGQSSYTYGSSAPLGGPQGTTQYAS